MFLRELFFALQPNLLDMAFLQSVVFPALNMCGALIGFITPIVYRLRCSEWARGGATEWLLLPTIYSLVIYTLYFIGIVENTALWLRPVFVFFLLAPAVPTFITLWEDKECRKNKSLHC